MSIPVMGQNNTSAEAIKILEGRLTRLSRLSDKWWDKISEAEKAGDVETSYKYEKKMNRCDDLQEGILEALGTLGFNWQITLDDNQHETFHINK